MKTCYICPRTATSAGYCAHHQNVRSQQMVLDALRFFNNQPTPQQRIAVHLMGELPSREVRSAIRRLYNDGFLVKTPSPGVRKAAKWSMV